MDVQLFQRGQQQDTVPGFERHPNLPHFLPDVLRRALYDAAPQIGKQLRPRIVRNGDAASQS